MPTEHDESLLNLKRRLLRLVRAELSRGRDDCRPSEEDEELAEVIAALRAAGVADTQH